VNGTLGSAAAILSLTTQMTYCTVIVNMRPVFSQSQSLGMKSIARSNISEVCEALPGRWPRSRSAQIVRVSKLSSLPDSVQDKSSTVLAIIQSSFPVL